MRIKTVTITGADDSINPRSLIELSQEYPFVEWGLLLSRSSMGGRRFPSLKWMEGLREDRFDETVNISGHICGQWVRDLLIGKISEFTKVINPVYDMFKRIQINTHGEKSNISNNGLVTALKSLDRQILIQFDEVNSWIYYCAKNAGINVFPFFDLSHGAGVLPERWPDFIGDYCGYAGGLGPDNLEEQLEKIESVIGDKNVWIDMETKVRSDNDEKFDIKKVRKCLEIVKLKIF